MARPSRTRRKSISRPLLCCQAEIQQLRVFEKFEIIHVAGSNGKGSTCAAIAGLLQSHGERTSYPKKIGLYTSPHLLHIRERICINGTPISKELFAERFFHIWQKLPREPTPDLDYPRYLQLLFLLAIDVFANQDIDVAIIETHMGGQHDATNVIPRPVVTAVTSLTEDHIHLLGPNLESIAHHKAGIFKAGSLAYSAPQACVAQQVLTTRAEQVGQTLHILPAEAEDLLERVATKCPAQRLNHRLAIAVTKAFLSVKAPVTDNDLLDDTIREGLQRVVLPGRFHNLEHDGMHLFLDGAHNDDALQSTARWYEANISSRWPSTEDRARSYPFLIFAHHSQRDSMQMLRVLLEALRQVHSHPKCIILTSYRRGDGVYRLGTFPHKYEP